MTEKNHRYCVIMCGGIGSRFWPYSRTMRPKQFIDFLGTGRTLLQMSYDRVLPLVPAENIYVVTNEQYAGQIREQLPELEARQLLFEPARRNTAPCIAWAAYHIAAQDAEASIMVAPSDHLITRERVFEEAIRKGFEFVEGHEALLTLGIHPTRPETGYGYIQIGERVEGDFFKVKTFTEKPNEELAQVFLDTGEFYWNSGIFLWTARTVIEELRRHAPDVAQTFDRGLKLFGTEKERAFIEENFPGCVGISIDFAVMEKSQRVYVECVNFGWSDLGTWRALYDLSPKNSEGNVTQGCTVQAYGSTGNIFAISRPDKLVVADGLKDYIVADADDVLLICPKAQEQGLRQIVNDVRRTWGEKYL